MHPKPEIAVSVNGVIRTSGTGVIPLPVLGSVYRPGKKQGHHMDWRNVKAAGRVKVKSVIKCSSNI